METKINTQEDRERVNKVVNDLRMLMCAERDEQKRAELSAHIAELTKIYAEYKVTYHSVECGLALVRVKDDLIIFANTDAKYVEAYAAGYCAAKQALYYVE